MSEHRITIALSPELETAVINLLFALTEALRAREPMSRTTASASADSDAEAPPSDPETPAGAPTPLSHADAPVPRYRKTGWTSVERDQIIVERGNAGDAWPTICQLISECGDQPPPAKQSYVSVRYYTLTGADPALRRANRSKDAPVELAESSPPVSPPPVSPPPVVPSSAVSPTSSPPRLSRTEALLRVSSAIAGVPVRLTPREIHDLAERDRVVLSDDLTSADLVRFNQWRRLRGLPQVEVIR